MIKKMKLKFLLCVSVFVFSGGVFSSDLSSICSSPKYSDALAGDLVVHVAEVPSLAESSVKGGFINFIKALDEVYKYGVINVRVYPYTRAIYGVAQGDADFSLPAAFNPKRVDPPGNVRLSAVSFGKVSMVLYTHKDSSVQVADLGGQRLKIVAVPTLWHFPVFRANGIPQAFNLLVSRRVDGVLGAQEESDYVLRDPKYKDIRRQHYGDFDDVFIVQNSERGQLVECVLSRSVEALRSSGRLADIYRGIHLPYSDIKL